MAERNGRVIFVGAGPGDPGLITLRGAECLRQAEVVIYDYLVSPALLAHTSPGCDIVCLGRHGQGRLMGQEEVNRLLVESAREGCNILRLKAGDPTLFARIGEEIAVLEAAGVTYEIVPGVSAFQAASSHAGIPLTHRDFASCVALVTGQESAGKSAADELDYGMLAKFPGTLVFYMGVTTAPKWTQELIENGKPASTPVAIARRCSFPDQSVIYTTLGEVAAVIEREKLRPPAVVIVGDVVQERAAANWFMSRPLFGRTVLVTRPGSADKGEAGGADELSEQLGDLGANVLQQPAITIGAPSDWAAVDAVIGRLDEFDWLVFSSANGVDYFMLRLSLLGHDARRLGELKIAAVGPATEESLLQYFLSADACPAVSRAEALAEELAPDAQAKRFLLVRGSRGREVLGEMLTAAGGKVEQVAVYESADVTEVDVDVAAAMSAGRIEFTTVTSSAIARSLVRMFGDALRKTRLIAISPITAEVLSDAGYPAHAVAENYESEGIVSAILTAADTSD